jgi:hypothetical protein
MRKFCGACGRWLPVGDLDSAFHRDSQRPDGHDGRCKTCRRRRYLELKRGAARFKPWQRRGACTSYSQAS